MSRALMNSLRMLGVVAALALTLQFLQPQSAFAAASITVYPAYGSVGMAVNVTGTGFQTGETVNIYFSGTALPVATTTAVGAAGNIATTFNVPPSTNGTHTVTAIGATSGRTATTAFQVLAPATTTLSLQKLVAVGGSGYHQTANASPGSTITYALTYTNNGPNTATNLTVTDPLFSGQTIQSVSAGCTYGPVAGTVTVVCQAGNVPAAPAAGSSGTFFIVTTIDAGFSGPLYNVARVRADNANEQASQQTVVTVTAPAATGTLQKYVSVNGLGYSTNAAARNSDVLTYDIRFTNTSNTTTASNVVITDFLQPGQDLLSQPATSAACTQYNNATGQVTCYIGSVAPLQTVDVYISTAVDTAAGGTISNRADATFNGGTIHSNYTYVQVGFTQPTAVGAFTLCGPVTNFTGNSITISGITVPLAGNVVSGGSIFVGANECISFSFNGYGQANALAVSSNLASVSVVCGVYQPSASAGAFILSGIGVTVQGGAGFQPLLVPGGFYCFLITPGGVAYAVLTNIPTEATLYHIAAHAGRQIAF